MGIVMNICGELGIVSLLSCKQVLKRLTGNYSRAVIENGWGEDVLVTEFGDFHFNDRVGACRCYFPIDKQVTICLAKYVEKLEWLHLSEADLTFFS